MLLFTTGTQSQASINADTESFLLTQQPRLMTPVAQGDIVPKVNPTLEKSIAETGGVAAILFLVAKVCLFQSRRLLNLNPFHSDRLHREY